MKSVKKTLLRSSWDRRFLLESSYKTDGLNLLQTKSSIARSPDISNREIGNLNLWLNQISTGGIILFFGLFYFASTLYPGGSQFDEHTVGFNWMHNYWCDLLGKNASNGQPNPARPFAIFAMILLCGSVGIFLYQLAQAFTQTVLWKKIIQICGCCSMLFAAFIFTEYHDEMILISSLFGVFAVIGVLKIIYQSNLLFYQLSGLICLFLLGLNNVIYYTGIGLSILPFIQKITFGGVLFWILGMNTKIRKRI